MSNLVLQYVREMDPRFKQVPDDELTQYIGERAPEFLQDPDFAEVFNARKEQSANSAETERAQSVTGMMADEAAGFGRVIRDSSLADWGRAVAPAAVDLVNSATAPVRAVADVGGAALNATGKMLRPDMRHLIEAAGDSSLNLPFNTALDPAGPVAKGLEDAAAIAPTIAATGALASVGIPMPVALAAPVAASTYQATGSIPAALEAGAVAMVIPKVMDLGKAATATIQSKLVTRGILSADAAGVQKFGEMLGGQSAVQVYLEGLNIPQYVQMTPDERRDAVIRNAIANTAFMALDVPHLMDGSPSQTAGKGSPGEVAARELRSLIDDPEVVDRLVEVANAAADPVRQDVPDNPLTTRDVPIGEVPNEIRQPATARPDVSGVDPAVPNVAPSEIKDFAPDAPRPPEDPPIQVENAPQEPAPFPEPVEQPKAVDQPQVQPASIDQPPPKAAKAPKRSNTPVNPWAGEPAGKVPKSEAARIAALVEEAQAIVNSAPKPGSPEAEARGITHTGVKRELVSRVETALANAPEELGVDGHPTKVVLAVPGDGVFVVGNSKPVLRALLKRAKAMDTAMGMPGTGSPRSSTPPKVGSLKKAEIPKLLEPFVSDDPGRPGIGSHWSDGKVTVATNGAVLVEVTGSAGARKTKGFPEEFPSLFPKPDQVKAGPFEVSAEDLWRAGRIVRTFEGDKNGLKFVKLGMREGGIFAEATDQNGDAASYGKPGDVAGSINIQGPILEEVAALARKTGSERVRISMGDSGPQGERSVMVVEGDHFRALLAGGVESEPAKPASEPAAEPPKGGGGGAEGTVGNAYPGGPLGTAPASPADNPGFSAFPMEMPEAVKFARDLAGGAYPKLRERIGLLGGRALGVFRHNDRAGKASIEMRRDVFDLPASERRRLMEEALTYAKAVASSPGEIRSVMEQRYEFLKREAFKENPIVALKVLWHEIGHWVDWVPDHMISGRGNLLGRLASLKDFLRHTLPEGPDVPDRPITDADRARMFREAEKQIRDEIGPIQDIVRTILVEEPEFRVSGVTPEDVKQLLGMDAREKMPELYRWFAEQPASAKKEILRAAMKGMVDERIAAQGGKREQVGTRVVERTVREKVGREPTAQEIRERFNKLLREELVRRRMIELKTVKAELEPLIAWWRGTEKMEDYFRPSAEMYAEAFSIFANNPAAMAKRAPTYYKVLTNYMTRKPEVAALYREIQNSLAAGTIMRDRVVDLRSSWAKDDRESMQRARDRVRLSPRDMLANVLYYVDDRLGPVYQIARRAQGDGGRLREAAGNYRYRAAEHELLLSRLNREVVEPLWAAGIHRDTLAEYMFHKHVTESRFTRNPDTKELVMLGNPMGWTPKNSLERLAEMRQQLGDEGFAKVEAAQARFREVYEEQVVSLLDKSGMASPELMQAIRDRTFYATFQKAKGEIQPDSIEAILEGAYGKEVSSRIYRQVGNLGEIKNPFTATVSKAMSLTSAAYRNILKRETVRAMTLHDPEHIRPAEVRWTGKRMEPVIVDQGRWGTVVLLEDGKVRAYYVPKAVAEAINGGQVVENLLALGSMRAMGWFKGLFTQLNYGFWPVAFVKDAAAWGMQMPGAGPVDYARHIVPGVKSAWEQFRGRKSESAERALSRKMLISRADPHGVMGGVDNEFDLAVASYGLDPVKWGEVDSKGGKLLRMWQAYREFGQVAERAQKIAGMEYLDRAFPEMPEWQKAEIVRERAGSPDFLRKGASAPYLDWVGMFYNPWKEGIRSFVKTVRDNPASFAAKSLGVVVAPAVLQSMAANGIFGQGLKDLYGSVSDYDLTNYLVVPLGWADRERKKAIYVRLPLWEPARIMHGSVFQMLTGRGQGIISMAGGQVPSLNPLAAVAMMWSDYYVLGRNPYDAFRGRELLSQDVFEAGGSPAAKELLKQTWNKMGGGIIGQFQTRPLGEPDPGAIEGFLKLPGVSNLVGRWIKVGNRGVFDQDRKAAEGARKDAAVRREAVRAIVDKLTAPNPQPLTAEERVILRDPVAQNYYWELRSKVAKSRASLDQQRLQRLPSRAEKAAAMQRVP